MRLFEYQAKQIFSENGIPVPASRLIQQKQEIPQDFYPSVFKAQILSGGRGKLGGIKFVDNFQQAEEIFSELMAFNVQGEVTQSILAEEKIDFEREYYLSFVIDKQNNVPIFLLSHSGGVEIEATAKSAHKNLLKLEIDYPFGLQPFDIQRAAKFIGTSFENDLQSIMLKIYQIFNHYDATLIEINPLAETQKGLIALDAKIILDGKAYFYHPELYEKLATQIDQNFQGRTRSEQWAQELEISYVPLQGNIGIISDGAGTGMLTLDLVIDAGGQAANFCELGGLGDAERMYQGLRIISANPDVKVILISLIGGITRMDHMAEGVARFIKNETCDIPIFIRLCGTQEEIGNQILDELGIYHDHDLQAIVEEAVLAARTSSQ